MLGCHRRPDRSFFWRGRQFPVCARCTGVYIGETIALVQFLIVHRVFLLLSLLFCAVMFLDWLIQYMEIRESTNRRRLMTGLLGGYGVMSLEIAWIAAAVRLACKLFSG